MPPSLSSLARTLGLSRTTVSDALSGKGRVSPETVKRVKEAAEAANYRVNPLFSTMLGSASRSRRTLPRGALAAVDVYEEGHWPHGPFPRELVAGAKERAAEIGFSVAEFVVGSKELSWPRLDSILRSRGICGILLLPCWFDPDFSQLDWSKYAGVYTDVVKTTPALHSVCCDHYGSMQALLHLLFERGYRRPGLFLQRGRDERLQGRQKASFCIFQEAHLALGERVPPLVVDDARSPRAEFLEWFRRHEPDVVLSHLPETAEWIGKCAPGDVAGFVLLNALDQEKPCAALDLQPRVLGARAVEMLAGQLLRDEFGIPESPSCVIVPAKWMEGPTVRSGPEISWRTA